MALNKDVVFKGVDAGYWKITDFNYSDTRKMMNVKMALYKDSIAREGDINNILDTLVVRIPLTVEDAELFELIKTVLYTKLKQPIMKEELDDKGGTVMVDINPFTEATDA